VEPGLAAMAQLSTSSGTGGYFKCYTRKYLLAQIQFSFLFIEK
jgi:hypothetical protein